MSNDQVTLYTGAYLILGNDVVKDDLWVSQGKIIDPKTVNYKADRVVDVAGKLISPGFIDLKLNGCFGINFSNPEHLSAASLSDVQKKLGEFGVTAFCPCVTTSTPSQYRSSLPVLHQSALSNTDGAEILGIHLDGPLHSDKKGHIEAASPLSDTVSKIHTVADLEGIYGGFDGVKIISMAPELDGVASTIIPQLTQRGIKVSLGHTVCSIEDAENAVNAGATMIGHLFNGMPNFHHRDPSLVGLLASHEIGNKEVYFGLIADLIHTHPASLAMAHKLHPKTLMVVSDAVEALGLAKIRDIENVFTRSDSMGIKMDIRRSTSGGLDEAEQGVAAFEHGTDRLIGSCTPIDDAIKNLLYYTDATLLEAIAAVTSRPAKAMGIGQTKGHLNYGADADFVTLDQHLNVLTTYAKGIQIYKRDSERPDSPGASRYADKIEIMLKPIRA